MADVVSASEFRNGLTIEFEGDIYTVVEFQHVKPGKGAAFVLYDAEERNRRWRDRAYFPSDGKGRPRDHRA